MMPTELRQIVHLLDEVERAERSKAELRKQEILGLFDQQKVDNAEPVGLGDWDAPEPPEPLTGEEDQLVLDCQLDTLKLFGEKGLDALQKWMESDEAEPKGLARRVVEFLQGKTPAATRGSRSKNPTYLRRLEGKAVSPDESRVYLTEEERALPLDKLWVHLKSRGFGISRSTAWWAKRSGYFNKPGVEYRGGGKKIYLTDEEKKLSPTLLAIRRGFSKATAYRALRRGWFMVTEGCGATADTAALAPLTEEERLVASLPEELVEIAGRRIDQWSPEELLATGVVSKLQDAKKIIKRGRMRVCCVSARRKPRLAKILKELEDFVWEPLSEPEIVVPPYVDGLDELRDHLFKEEGVYIRSRKILERIKRKEFFTITGRMRRKS